MTLFIANTIIGWIGGFFLGMIYFYGWKIRRANNKNKELIDKLKPGSADAEWKVKMEYIRGRLDVISEMF